MQQVEVGQKIVIVDDAPEIIDVVSKILSGMYQLSSAVNGEEALKIVSSLAPDLILLDVRMPGMNGLEVCRRLKKNKRTRDIPVIFITSKIETKDIVMGFEAGAVDYVRKPFNPNELLARVKNQMLIKYTPHVVSKILSGMYQLSSAVNGEQALEIVSSLAPDLILLDVVMPGIDGFEVCRRLKKNKSTRNIPVIFITSKTETKDIVKGFEVGAVDYVRKPFNPTELLARVKNQMFIKYRKDVIVQRKKDQKDLIYVLCHDLSNNFTAAKMALEIVQRKKVGALDRHYCTLHKAVDNSMELISLVREMCLLEEGKKEPAVVDLYKAVEESKMLVLNKALKKGIEIKTNIKKGVFVVTEKRFLINSVINNLLTNAIKFSFKNSSIDVSTRTDKDKIALTVRDYGIGMSEHLLSNLFDLTKKTSRPGTDGEPGIGYGLPLVKKFVELYDGSLQISSKEQNTLCPNDHGTLIEVMLKKPGREEDLKSINMGLSRP